MTNTLTRIRRAVARSAVLQILLLIVVLLVVLLASEYLDLFPG